MKRNLSIPSSVAIALMTMLVLAGSVRAAESLMVQVQLVWATNDPRSPDPKHKPIDADLEAKLKLSPYRWTNYFEVNRQVLTVPLAGTGEAQMSKRCRLDVKNLGNDRVQVKLYGQDKLVATHTDRIASDWPLILSGNADNQTAWLVVVKKVEPEPAK